MTSSVWFITGTTSGFGRRLVKAVLARGDRVIATGKSQEKLEELVASLDSCLRKSLHTVQLDVTEGEDALKDKVKRSAAVWGRIDVLVNNAGVGYPSLLEEGGSSLLKKQMAVNVFGTLDMTVAVLPYLRSSSNPALVVIGSRSAWKTDIPGVGFYASSKSALHALTETFALELAGSNIRVLLVAPGSFRTEGIYGQEYNTDTPIAAYDTLRNFSISRFKSIAGTEKGDPEKAMEFLVDVIRGEGVAKDRPWPQYLILGEDAERDVREKCRKVINALDDWKDVSSKLSFD